MVIEGLKRGFPQSLQLVILESAMKVYVGFISELKSTALQSAHLQRVIIIVQKEFLYLKF